MRRLLILWHSRTGTADALAQAAMAGAQAAAPDVAVGRVPADAITPDQMRTADAYLFVGPENLAALSGAMKEALDTLYYPLLGAIEGRPYGHIVAAGSDGAGAARQLARIVTGWRLRAVMEPLIITTHADTPAAILAPKTLAAADHAAAHDAGARIAAGLSIGMF